MQNIDNMVSYYDAFFRPSHDVEDFYESVVGQLPCTGPCKVLSIAAGGGTLEFHLARAGCDVTGLEVFNPLLEIASQQRPHMLAIRFFKMSTLAMGKYLGNAFYNLIYSNGNRVAFLKTKDNVATFFDECRALLAEKGAVILHYYNYNLLDNQEKITLSKKETMGATLNTTIARDADNHVYFTQEIQTNAGTALPIFSSEEIFPLTSSSVEDFAKNAGFKTLDFYSDFNQSPLSEKSEEVVCIMR